MATLLHKAPESLRAPAFERSPAPVQLTIEAVPPLQLEPAWRDLDDRASHRAMALIALLLVLLAVGYAATGVSVTFLLVGGVLAAAALGLLTAFGLWVQDNNF
jgi:hypothetical protein